VTIRDMDVVVDVAPGMEHQGQAEFTPSTLGPARTSARWPRRSGKEAVEELGVPWPKGLISCGRVRTPVEREYRGDQETRVDPDGPGQGF